MLLSLPTSIPCLCLEQQLGTHYLFPHSPARPGSTPGRDEIRQYVASPQVPKSIKYHHGPLRASWHLGCESQIHQISLAPPTPTSTCNYCHTPPQRPARTGTVVSRDTDWRLGRHPGQDPSHHQGRLWQKWEAAPRETAPCCPSSAACFWQLPLWRTLKN